MASRSPSATHLRSESPLRVPDSSSVPKKLPWVNPLGSPRHSIHPKELQQKELGSRGRSPTPRHKENGGHGRSPAGSRAKGSKNFMSPTICASSKVTAASPKRKVLSERNEAVSSSFSSSATDSGFEMLSGAMSPYSQDDTDADTHVGISCETETDSLDFPVRRWETQLGSGGRRCGLEEIDSWELYARSKESKMDPGDLMHLLPSPGFHSPDVHAISLPPYDPETNYLSPRPQFLHYKPKSRPRSGDGKLLLDSFSWESSDASSQTSSEDAQSSITLKSLEEDCGKDSVAATSPVQVKKTAEATDIGVIAIEKRRSEFVFPTKVAAFLMLLTITCFCITISDTPIISSPTSSLPNWDFSSHHIRVGGALRGSNLGNHWPKGASFGSSKIKDFGKFGASDLGHYWYKGVSFCDSKIRELGKLLQQWSLPLSADLPNEDHFLFHYLNITPEFDPNADFLAVSPVLVNLGNPKLEEITVERDLCYVSHETEEDVQNVEFNGGGGGGGALAVDEYEEEEEEIESNLADCDELEEDVQIGTIDPASIEAKKEELQADSTELQDVEMAESFGIDTEAEINNKPLLVELEADNLEMSTDTSTEEKMMPLAVEEEAVAAATEEEKPLAVEIDEQEEEDVTEPTTPSDEEDAKSLADQDEELSEEVRGSKQREEYPSGVIASAILLSLFVAIGAVVSCFFNFKHLKGPEIATKKKTLLNEIRQDDEWKTPTKLVEEEEVGQQRRDSSASSSTSFGSFTTYEKLSGKKKMRAQEEVLTPVRRSSRIRKQVTSP